MASTLTIFGWHNVEPTWCFPNQRSGARQLESQLRKLRAVANVVPLTAALESLSAQRPLPPRAVALCWDDGYRDNLDLAAPILERLELPGTFFLVPGLLSGERCAWWEIAGWAFARSTRQVARWEGRDLPTRGAQGRASYSWASDRLRVMTSEVRREALDDLVDRLAPDGDPGDRELFLDWRGARELLHRGFEVGSHTMRHVTLAQETAEAQVTDLRESRETLERELDIDIRIVAYPFGQSDAVSGTTQEAALEAGYSHALTTMAGLNTCATSRAAGHRIMMDPAQGFVSAGWSRVRGKLSSLKR